MSLNCWQAIALLSALNPIIASLLSVLLLGAAPLSHARLLAEEPPQSAQFLSQPAEPGDRAYLEYWQLGRLRVLQGDREGAIAAYREAATHLSTHLQSLARHQRGRRATADRFFGEISTPIYHELLALLLGTPGESPSQEQLQQARQVMDALQQTELDHFLPEASAAEPFVAVDQIDPGAAVIYPILLRDRLALIVSLPDQPLRYYATFIPEAEVLAAIDAMRQSLRRTAFATEYLPASQRVYDLFIRPFAPDLAAHPIKTLVFALDHSLQTIPLAALHDGTAYLVERYNLVLVPELQLPAPRRLPEQGLRVLISGLSEARQGFPALPAVQQEIRQITTNLSAHVLLNQAFTQDQFRRQIQDDSYTIVHLATHGQFSSTAADTFLLTWDGRLRLDQLDALLRFRAEHTLHPIELLILSACQTAMGDRHAALGFAGVAVRLGARSTLATLWLINDQATADLMTVFYRGLVQSHLSRSESLRHAQLSLLHHPQYRHPYYWAAFVLIGNWL